MQRVFAVLCLTALALVPAFAALPTAANIQGPLAASLAPGGAAVNAALAAGTALAVPPIVAQQIATAAAGSFAPFVPQMALNAATAAQNALGTGRGTALAIADAETAALTVANTALPNAEAVARTTTLAGGVADPLATNAARAASAAILGQIAGIVGTSVGNAIAAP